MGLRAEVTTAWEAWQANHDDYELEQDYFEKLTALDRKAGGTRLERGETIDEEVPLRPELRRPPFERSSFDGTEGNGYGP
jgi:hypothetical protein